MNNEQRYQLIVKILAVQEQNNNSEDRDKFLSDPNLALQAMTEVTFADSESDLALLRREGWFGDNG